MARFLLSLTILYNVVEGVVALWSGISAGSVALVAFGADSYLEVGAAAVVLWRLGIKDSEHAEVVEQRAVGSLAGLFWRCRRPSCFSRRGWSSRGAAPRSRWWASGLRSRL